MKTNFILICDQAFLTAGSNNLNLIGIFTQINSQQFPVRYPHFALVVNFDATSMGAHTLNTKIIDPNGVQLAQASAPIDIKSSPFQIITNFENLTFNTPGTYEIKIALDSTDIGSQKLELLPIHHHQKVNLA